MLLSKKPAVVYLNRSRLDLYGSNIPAPISIDLPGSCIRDMEVVSEEAVAILIKMLMERNKVTPTATVIVLSEHICFQRDFTDPADPVQHVEVQQFLDNMPFAKVSSKMYRLGKTYRLVAVNRELYEAFKRSLEKCGFTVSAVIPAFMLQKNLVETDFNPQTGESILGEFDVLKQHSLLEDNVSSSPAAGGGKKKESPLKNQKVMVALAVSLYGAAIILVYLWYITNNGKAAQAPQPTRDVQVTRAYTPTPVAAASPTPIREASVSAALARTLRIRIINGSGRQGLDETVKVNLEKAGFGNIELGKPESISAAKTVMMVGANVPREVREQISLEIKKSVPDVVVQESGNAQFDIVIVIAPIL